MSIIKRPWDVLHEIVRDHARDSFCAGLQSLGIDAELLPRNAPEEQVSSDCGDGESLGVIAISPGPIRWLSIRADQDEDGKYYEADYGVPDARLANSHLPPILKIKPSTDRWKGEDMGLGVLDMLNGRSSTPGRLAGSRTITIVAHGASQCWTLTVRLGGSPLFGWLWRATAPSSAEWRCYQVIAECLLATKLRELPPEGRPGKRYWWDDDRV